MDKMKQVEMIDPLSGKSINLTIACNHRFLVIGADGYGEKTAEQGQGHPIIIEFYDGDIRLLVWSDIDSEEPTHIISLKGAREK